MIEWDLNPDGSMRLGVLTGFQMATMPGGVAVRVQVARTQDELRSGQGGFDQLALPPDVAYQLGKALIEASRHSAD